MAFGQIPGRWFTTHERNPGRFWRDSGDVRVLGLLAALMSNSFFSRAATKSCELQTRLWILSWGRERPCLWGNNEH